MTSVPNKDKVYSQTNKSDLFGNIYVTRNVNFDESGYIKLSPRSISVGNSTDLSFLGFSLGIGRYSGARYYLATTDTQCLLSLLEGSMSFSEDENLLYPALSGSFASHGVWWQNNWYVSNSSKIQYRNHSNGNWTDAVASLEDATVLHPLCVFSNLDTLCVGMGNKVSQFDTAHSETTQLVFSSRLEVTSMAYSSGRLGIGTRLSGDAAGQSGEAHFLIWTGSTAEAAVDVPVGSDTILCVKAYKSSFVILTREGVILYWNGGGFTPLTYLPSYFLDKTWGDSEGLSGFRDILSVVGDRLYVNVNQNMNYYGIKSETSLPNTPGGILCYDGSVGMYHKFSPSVSGFAVLSVTSGNVNTSSNIFTTSVSSDFQSMPATGSPVKYTYDKGSQIGGLQTGRVYYLIVISATEFALAETYEDAVQGNKIDITSTGASTNIFIALDFKDFGATRFNRTASISTVDYSTHVLRDMLFATECYLPDDIESLEYHLCAVCEGFRNIGYFIISKYTSDTVTDIYKNFYLKFRPLGPEDSITVKKKVRSFYGLPVTTPQLDIAGVWTNDTTFTTTADISEAMAYLAVTGHELECELTSGAGAGFLPQVSSITYDSGTYTVVLDQSILGVAANDECTFVMDTWEVMGTATSQDEGIKNLPVGTVSKDMLFKVILDGVGIVVEEARPIIGTYQSQ